MGSYAEHQDLISRFKVLCQKEIANSRCFDRHVGKFLVVRFIKDLLSGNCKISDHKRYYIQINRAGMADLYVLIPTKYGLIHIEVEAKTGKAKLSSHQKIWRDFIVKRMGGIYILMRDEYDAVTEIKKELENLIS